MQRNYSTTESEALAVVASLKEFYPYVYSFPCKLITEHKPLKSLKGIKDVGGHVTRWLLFLQQFNVITTHPKFINNINMNKGFETYINIQFYFTNISSFAVTICNNYQLINCLWLIYKQFSLIEKHPLYSRSDKWAADNSM